jgi:hypothetical protein
MSIVNNNQFEVKPSTKCKRRITSPCPNVYLNPGLDLLANEDPMCNTAMEIVPNKKRKRSRSCEIAAFENTGLDIGISKAVVNEFLARELQNVRNNMRSEVHETTPKAEDVVPDEEPIYANITDISMSNNDVNMSVVVAPERKESPEQPDISDIEMESNISVIEQESSNVAPKNNDINLNNNKDYSQTLTEVEKTVTNRVIINNTSNISLSFIDRLALDSPSLSNQSLYLDDDLNESNIMEIKTITIITKKKRIVDKKKNTNPFLEPNFSDNYLESSNNPFIGDGKTKTKLAYREEVLDCPADINIPQGSNFLPRRLFAGDTNSTISTVNESMYPESHEYENIDNYRSESPIYENIGGEPEPNVNKQSKILGYDVSKFSAADIINLNKNSEANHSNDSNDSKKDLKHHFLKAGNKLSKKVLKTLKKTFKHDKADHNVTLNPYEVPRKPPKQKQSTPKESGIENPCLNLDNSDEIEIEELDEEHQYETIKTLRNTQLNMNVTPLRERTFDNFDTSHSRQHTPGKKVRFDSTLNREKVITGNSFDCSIQSPGFDAKIDKYHDELENCINERKFIQQNM